MTKGIEFLDITGSKAFKCPDCGECISIPERTKESLQHIEEIDSSTKMRREADKTMSTDIPSLRNIRPFICPKCGMKITTIDQHSIKIGALPPIPRAEDCNEGM